VAGQVTAMPRWVRGDFVCSLEEEGALGAQAQNSNLGSLPPKGLTAFFPGSLSQFGCPRPWQMRRKQYRKIVETGGAVFGRTPLPHATQPKTDPKRGNCACGVCVCMCPT
jgi:hypothetical protein